ncbi:MAG: chromosomal replication initiator protein DnaA [Comamonadaceae bacterium]|nr:chromosomal replication initiator protein DnaA [Comamonadaceae bacterium]
MNDVIKPAADDAGLWQRCLERLALEVPGPQFAAWIKPLRVESNGASVHIYVPNRIALDHIRKRYLERMAVLLQEIGGQHIQLEVSLASRTAKPGRAVGAKPGAAALRVAQTRGPAQAGAVRALPLPDGAPQPVQALATQMQTDLLVASYAQEHEGQAWPEMQDAVPAHAAPVEMDEVVATPAVGASVGGVAGARLDPQLNFDNLIEGSANRMARAAALHVAHAPGQLYNPLFIYGGVGLGKTHLMHAVGNQMLAERPDAKVLYIHAEQFVTDVVRSYQRKTFDALKQRYHSLDLLLIDDVQFIAGKERTQEEFFNAFEALLSRRSHIVMTSDTYPKGLTDIHERLVSRFDAGLTVAIEPPELEMRVAILIDKARSEGIQLSKEVAFYVAKNVRSNVRELEGALRKVLAYARFNHLEISIPVARDALRDLLSIQNRQIGVENIQKTVADFYKIKVADMYSKKRPASIARPRQIAMYLAKELTQKSLPEIGELFGGRDHTTVLHAVRKIAQERQQQPELNQQLHVLEQTLKR